MLVGSPAFAATSGSSAGTGNGVSYPQCGKTLPSRPAFGIVGVNGGRASTLNPCFPMQLAWAKASVGGTTQPLAAVYVNTGNPGDVYVTNPSLVSYWPTSGTNSFGTCAGGNTAACAYEYGKYMAGKDAAYVAKSDGSTIFTYWLDIETGNSWSVNTVNNRADLIGMVDYFHGIGSPVGLYSTSYQWRQIAGIATYSGSPLAGLQSWLPVSGCAESIGGQVELFVTGVDPERHGDAHTIRVGGIRLRDYDYSCQ